MTRCLVPFFLAWLTISNGTPAQAATIPSADGAVYSIGVQPDGRIVLGGAFSSFNGTPRACLARLNPDGTLDTQFNPGATGGIGTNAVIYSLATQSDGKILVAGNFTNLSGNVCNNIGRLNADGTLDQSFTASADYPVYTLVVQEDGMILVGGAFTALDGQARDYIGRFDTNGVLDLDFDPGADFAVYALTIQPDNRILAGGNFTELAGQTRQGLGRLNSDGTLDETFNSMADQTVICFALQGDGQILVGGFFSMLAGQPQNAIGRLAPDGSLDAAFMAGASGGQTPFVYSLAVQTDGKILAGGGFASLSGASRSAIGRLNPDGTLDTSFDTEADQPVFALGLGSDGNIWAGGLFGSLGGVPRSCIGLMTNNESPIQNLTFDGSTVSWLRGGSSPELCRMSFDISTNGTDWTSLGQGTRVAGGWQLTNVSVTARASLRARGLVAGGYENASTWFIQTVRPALFVDGLNAGQFSLGIVGSAGQIVTIEASTDLLNWTPLATNTLSAGANLFVDPQPPFFQQRFYRAVTQ